MHSTSARTALALVFLTACVSAESTGVPVRAPTGGAARELAAPARSADETPQSYTPPTRPAAKDNALYVRWKARVGATDARTTMVALAGGLVAIATRSGGEGARLFVVDGKEGVVRATVPSPDASSFVGVASLGGALFASTEAGAVIAATPEGKVLFATKTKIALTTPPTLADFDGDGAAEIAAGGARGQIVLLDATSGKVKGATTIPSEGKAVGYGLAAADIDGDGAAELFVPTERGDLVAYSLKKSKALWTEHRDSALRAAPVLADVDENGRLEVVVGWADGEVAILEAKSGARLWDATVELDNGDPTGLTASPTPVPGFRVGSLVVPTARWGKEDSVILLRQHFRAYQSKQGRVTASPVVARVDRDLAPEAIVGTEAGDLVAIDASGEEKFLFALKEPISASALLGDVDGDGVLDIVVVTKGGSLTALSTGVASPPLLGRARGNSGANDGVVRGAPLGWHLRRP